jgi:hypothetical protein
MDTVGEYAHSAVGSSRGQGGGGQTEDIAQGLLPVQ